MSQAVVQAAREVQQVQNRFQNLGGKFAEGLQIVEAKAQKRREAKEKLVQQSLNRARKNAKALDNNINTLGFSEEETQIIKDMSLEKTEKFYALQGQLAQFDNPSSPEAQELVNEMNGIRNWFTNVEKQQKQRLGQREQYNSDLGDDDSSGISIASQNQTFANNAEMINLGSFSTIDPVSGEFLWGEEGGYMGLASGAEYIMNPGKLFELIDKHEAQATAKNQPLTSGQVNLAVKRFKKLIDNKNSLASLLASDNPVAEAYGSDLQDRFDKAYEANDEEALEAIAEEVAKGYETYLTGINNKHVAEIKANQDPGKPPAPKSRFSDNVAGKLTTIKNAQKAGSPPIELFGSYDGKYKWSGATEMFYKVDKDGNPIMKPNGEPMTVTLQNIVDYGGINNLRLKDITKSK